MNKTEQGELISAVADGEVQGDALGQALEALEVDSQLQSVWETYHLVGDVLRSSDLASGTSSAAFLARLRPALATAEVQAPLPPIVQPRLTADPGQRAPASNDARWKIVAGLASVAAVLAVGWNAAGLGGVGSGQPQLAASPAQPAAVLASGERNLMLRDARLDELLAAHRQFGSATVIQMPAGAVRNAAFETPTR